MTAQRPLRMVVTGRHGQVTRALKELRQDGFEIVQVGKPELDLSDPLDPTRSFAALHPDVIVNAAAYTAVDKAESEKELAHAINARGAGLVARAAAKLGVPIIQISTDYVFDGKSSRPYREDDETNPLSVYGQTKREGEIEVSKATANHVILRTSWVYAAHGKNFVFTMLRLASEREEVRVVDDQHGAPTAASDIAAAVVEIAKQLIDRPKDEALRGLYHLANSGETTWAGVAAEIFKISAERGGPSARVIPISTAEYPTAAKRPASSRLDISKISTFPGVKLRSWNDALRDTLNRVAAIQK